MFFLEVVLFQDNDNVRCVFGEWPAPTHRMFYERLIRGGDTLSVVHALISVCSATNLTQQQQQYMFLCIHRSMSASHSIMARPGKLRTPKSRFHSTVLFSSGVALLGWACHTHTNEGTGILLCVSPLLFSWAASDNSWPRYPWTTPRRVPSSTCSSIKTLRYANVTLSFMCSCEAFCCDF